MEDCGPLCIAAFCFEIVKQSDHMISTDLSSRLDNIEKLIKETNEKLNKIHPVYTGNMQPVPFNAKGMKENPVIQRLDYCLPISNYTFKILKTIEDEELVAQVNFVGSSNIRVISDKINKIVSKCKNLNDKHLCIILGLAKKIDYLWAQSESDIKTRNILTRLLFAISKIFSGIAKIKIPDQS